MAAGWIDRHDGEDSARTGIADQGDACRPIATARSRWRGSTSPTANIDLIAYGCTAAGFISGPAGDAELQAKLTEATGLPVVTTARAMVSALQHDGAKRIAVVTPYHDVVNQQLAAFLADGGISVARMDTFRAPDVIALGKITAEQVRDLARATMGPDCDAMFIGCSQLPTHAILDDLQTEFERPAWSSICATAWDARRLPVTAFQARYVETLRPIQRTPEREEVMRRFRLALAAVLLCAFAQHAQRAEFSGPSDPARHPLRHRRHHGYRRTDRRSGDGRSTRPTGVRR